jgi:hypothetical protein
MVKERWGVVAEIDEVSTGSKLVPRHLLIQRKTLRHLLESFYEQLNGSISQQAFSSGVDTSKSVFLGVSVANRSTVNMSRIDKNMEDSRRHVERLLLRLDFNGVLSQPRKGGSSEEILSGLPST